METTVNERLKTYITGMKFSNIEFAKSIGVSVQMVGNWFLRESAVAIPPKHLLKIIEKFDIDGHWLLTGKRIEPVNNYQSGDYNSNIKIAGNNNLNESFVNYKDKEIRKLEEQIEELKRDKEFLQQLLNTKFK